VLLPGSENQLYQEVLFLWGWHPFDARQNRVQAVEVFLKIFSWLLRERGENMLDVTF
jgi:hypothetical protein